MKRFLTIITLRSFQLFAYAEGGLLPMILLVAIVHWVTGYGNTLVAVVGATHGSVFTVYMLLVPVVAWTLKWSRKTVWIAFSVAFIPFATWNFERRIHEDLVTKVRGGIDAKGQTH